MGKESRRKRRDKGKQSTVVPDDVLDYGWMTIARYGNVVQFQNNATPEEHGALIERLKAAHQEALKELSTAVPDLQKLVSQYSPIDLMHRAIYELLPIFLKHKSESEYRFDEALALPSSEYLQYLIARTPFSEPSELTNDGWDAIWSGVLHVLTLTHTYLMTRRGDANGSSEELTELRQVIDGMRLQGRIKRYGFYFADYLTSTLNHYDPWITEAYGISAADLIAGLLRIFEYQGRGLLDRHVDAMGKVSDLMADLAAQGYTVTRDATPEEAERTRAAVQSDDFREQQTAVEEALRRAFTPEVFDITEVSGLPPAVMSVLSVRPGQDILQTLTGPHHDDLSPLSPSLLHARPFLEINGRIISLITRD